MHAAGGKLLATETGVYLSVGDFLLSKSRAQRDDSLFGKILRLDANGTGVSARIVSKGHRNPQGMALLNESTMLATEHGPRGGDEMNLIDLSAASTPNYGWPLRSYGNHYNGTSIESTHAPQFLEPLLYFPYLLVGAHGVGDIKHLEDNAYAIATLNDKKVYVVYYDHSGAKRVFLRAITVGHRVRTVTPMDGCRVVLITELVPRAYTQPVNRIGPVAEVNVCGDRLRFERP